MKTEKICPNCRHSSSVYQYCIRCGTKLIEATSLRCCSEPSPYAFGIFDRTDYCGNCGKERKQDADRIPKDQ